VRVQGDDSAHIKQNDLNEFFEDMAPIYDKGGNVTNAVLAKTCGLMISYYDYTMIRFVLTMTLLRHIGSLENHLRVSLSLGQLTM
jgi:hypothetical protein